MGSTAKQWIDPTFMAPNVREIAIAEAVRTRLHDLAPELQAMLARAGLDLPVGAGRTVRLNRIDVAGWNSDIAWLSQDDLASFAWFEGLFGELGLAQAVAPHVHCDRSVVMYSGFFVTRSFCEAPHFHLDWDGLDNQCFTFLTPVTANCTEIPMVYKTVRGQEAHYRYQSGQGILFGDRFMHSTAPGRTDAPTVMLSFSFGTDRMEHYERMLKSSYQGPFHRRPDGVFVRDGKPVSLP